MSNQDTTDPTENRGADPATEASGDGFGAFSAPQSGGRSPATPDADLVCQAEDLKGLLQQIAVQIANADERHSQSLRDMHERLELIGGQARRAKANIPDDFQPAFERIEDAVSLLAERIATADAERQERLSPSPSEPAEPAPEPSSLMDVFADLRAEPMPAPIELPEAAQGEGEPGISEDAGDAPAPAAGEAEPDAHQPYAGAAPLADEAAHEPAVLKSAVTQPNGAAVPGTPDNAARPTAQAVDPFEFANTSGGGDSVAADPAEPWDEESASALVALYESGQTGVPASGALDEPAPDAGHSASPEPGEVETVATATGDDIDRDWLEARFADIAARVEMSLADMQPEVSLEEFGLRFDLFEERITNALADAADERGVDGLANVEGYLAELTGHLEQAQFQLQRLDKIEDQICLVAAQVTHVQSRQDAGNTSPSENDIHAIAETVGRHVVSSMSGSQSSDEASERIGALQETLNIYMSERREGEENTTGALDVMQSALIQLLERVDAIECQNDAASAGAAVKAAAQLKGAGAPHEYVREAVRFKVDDDKGAGQLPALDRGELNAAADDASLLADVAAASAASHQVSRGHLLAHATEDDPQASDAEEREEPKFGHTDHRWAGESENGALSGSAVRAEQSFDANAPPAAEHSSRMSLEGDRADFIAQARRAQRLAGERMEDEERERAAMAKPGLTSRFKSSGASAAPKQAGKGLPRPMLMVAGVLAVMAMGTLLYGKMFGGSRAPSKVERQLLAPRANAPGAKAPGAKAPSAKASTTNATVGAPGASAPVKPVIKNRSDRSGLGGGALGQKPVNRFAPRSVPETVTDDLSLNETAPMFGEAFVSQKMSADTTLPDRAPRGVAIVGAGAPLSDSAMARIRENQNMARLSHGLSGGDEVVRPARVTRTALQPPAASVSPVKAMGAVKAGKHLNMPPARIGPLSLRLAAAKGDPSAEFEVAARFAEGKGIKQDFGEAAKWYRRSAARGFAPSQYRIGTLYERGLGTKPDLARAGIWYLRAAKQGNVKAMHNLAVLSTGREGNAPDYATAVQWFSEAGKRGLTDSQFNLGILYGTGLGVALDSVQSYKWFALAAIGGDTQAAGRRDMLRTKLSPADLASAERLVMSWRKAPVERLVNDPRAAGQAWLSHQGSKKAG